MRVVADLHVHSRFSRACSQLLTLENNALWCHKKGVNVLGTGDFTHPGWFEEIETQLIDAEPGMYKLASGNHADVRFVMTSEVSQIYKRDGKTRRIHNLIFAPSRKAAKRVNAWLAESGFNIKSDGRPILGLDSEELYKRLKEIDNDIMLCPAHVWTPWFALFGSKSGFDSMEECFGEMTKEIFSLETGLSSDPRMNRSWSHLDRVALISNSDAHSPQNFGREANVFDIPETELSFVSLMNAIKTCDTKRFLYTIEFFPEEGKYHIDGHAQCNFSCEPAETKRLGGKCPKCGGAITVGVLSRVEQLADRAQKKEVMDGYVPYKSIIPLPELIGLALGKRSAAKKVQEIYEQMIANGGNEFSLLLDASAQDLCALSDERIADAIMYMREGDISWHAGYDGVFGKPQFQKNVRMQEILL